VPVLIAAAGCQADENSCQTDLMTVRVTLLDVARRAGVSRTTASFVLTGRRDMRISADAEQRVMQAARELNYRPNLMARSLRTSFSHTIGLVSDTIATGAYAGELIRGSLATALIHNNLLIVGETEGDAGMEKRLIEDMLDRGVDGFLYASMFTREVRAPSSFRGHRVVMVNCAVRLRRVPSVVPDEVSAGRTAVEALLAAGHRDHIYIVGETTADIYAARKRRAGIEAALAAADARIAGQIGTLWWPQSSYLAVRDFLRTDPNVTAFVCLNDRVAFGVYQALQEAGRRIPEDVSVVAFDDSNLARWMRPELSSVALPYFELGRRAVELLLDGSGTGGVELVPMPLSERGSIGPPAD
jgi:LacI family transcriptional regulator